MAGQWPAALLLAGLLLAGLLLAGLLARLGVDPADAGRAAAEPTRVIVAVTVERCHAGDCLAVLAKRSEAIGVLTAA